MSDNLRQYRAIREALIQGYPGEPTGRLARHLATLAAFISGIVASKSTQLPKVAAKVPMGIKPESRVKRFARWLDNARILEEVYFCTRSGYESLTLAIPPSYGVPYRHGYAPIITTRPLGTDTTRSAGLYCRA